LNPSVAIVIGTRPEIIKMAPIIRELEKRKLKYFIIHSGQHYSYNLDRIFFEQLNLPKPTHKLEVGSKSPGEQTANIIAKATKILQKIKPSIVLVEGDTNTVLAGAIAARKLNIPLGHVEAGLRSYDPIMPEEWNRKLADHCSDYLFAPTRNSRKNLLSEGISKNKIFVTGNTIVDSVYYNVRIAKKKPELFEELNLKSKEFFLVSLHRQENVDDVKRFKSLVKSLTLLEQKYRLPIVFPIHPRAKKMARKFKLNFGNIILIEPIDYLSFLFLEKNAKVVLTDSGGVQEETCILKVPCVTLRYNTERPETLTVGSNVIAGTTPTKILSCVNKMMGKKQSWKNPFGDGKAAKKIVKILIDVIQNN